MKTNTLTPALLHQKDAYWRAANYLSVGQIYLYDNPLLKRPLTLADIKHMLPAGGQQRTKTKLKNERTIMLSKAKTLQGYKLDSLDGEIGKVKEFYFDDRHWTDSLSGRQHWKLAYGQAGADFPVCAGRRDQSRAAHRH